MEQSFFGRLWSRLTERRQLSMRNRTTDEIHWKLNITPVALWGVVVTVILLIAVTLTLLMAYTSILDILPGYRTRAEATKEELTENIIRIDSMERQMAMILSYNEAVTQIMSGSTPTMHSTIMTDTIRYDKSLVLPTRADSLLRSALERTSGEYSLNNTKPLRNEAAMFSAPMRGTITRNFEAPESSFDIAILPLDGDNSVMAVENGTVVGVDGTVEGNISVTIQHNGGYVSIYRQLGEVLVRKGQSVQSGSVIAHLIPTELSEDDHTTTNRELCFELWRNGTAVDPEQYILFQQTL